MPSVLAAPTLRQRRARQIGQPARVVQFPVGQQAGERGRRLFVAAEKAAEGYGGTAAVSRATGVARSTVIRGAKDLLAVSSPTLRVRREGAGRPASGKAHPTMLE